MTGTDLEQDVKGNFINLWPLLASTNYTFKITGFYFLVLEIMKVFVVNHTELKFNVDFLKNI